MERLSWLNRLDRRSFLTPRWRDCGCRPCRILNRISSMMATGASLVSLTFADLTLSRSTACWAFFWTRWGFCDISRGDLLTTLLPSSYSSRILPCLNNRRRALIVWLTLEELALARFLELVAVEGLEGGMGNKTNRSKRTWSAMTLSAL